MIEQKGSLTLYRGMNGSLMVKQTEHYRNCDTLSTIRNYFMLGNVRLNGSQAVTVKEWFDRAARGEFDQ